MKNKLIALAFMSFALSGCGSDDPTSDSPKTTTPGNTTINLLQSGTSLISVNATYGCGINKDGALMCWGDKEAAGLIGATVAAEDAMKATKTIAAKASSVSTSGKFACAIADGKALCWGDNTNGQLGIGSGTATANATNQVSGLDSNVTSIAAGTGFACAVQKGAAKCWGLATNGVLGNDNDTDNQNAPVQVDGLTANVVSVVAGATHACALISDGTVKCWGKNNKGQLGNGTTDNAKKPIAVLGLKSVLQISAGAYHTCAIVYGGGVSCWGDNTNSKLGVTPSTTDGTFEKSPLAIANFTATSIAAGQDSTCAVSGEAVSCWGKNDANQLAYTSTTAGADVKVPTKATVDGAKEKVKAVSIYTNTICVLSTANVASCLGANGSNQLANNTDSQDNYAAFNDVASF